MSVNNINNNSAILNLALNNSFQAKSSSQVDFKEIFDSYIESDETEKFKEIVNKYDLKHMSKNELNCLTKELFDNKLISEDEKASLINAGNPTLRCTKDLIRKSESGPFKEYILYEDIKHPENVKTNFLDTWLKSQEINKQVGVDQSRINSTQKIIDILQKITYFQNK